MISYCRFNFLRRHRFRWYVRFIDWTGQLRRLYCRVRQRFYWVVFLLALFWMGRSCLRLFFVFLRKIIICILSSKMARRFGGVNGVYLYPTNPIRLVLPISSTNWSGVPKSRWCLSANGCRLYTLNPMEVAKAINDRSWLKLTQLITSFPRGPVLSIVLISKLNLIWVKVNMTKIKCRLGVV